MRRLSCNLLADLRDPRFDGMRVHEALEELDARGIHVQRHLRTPERYLSWIDAEFGGWWSSAAYAGSAYIAEDAQGPVGFAAFDPQGPRFSRSRVPALHEDVGIFGGFGVMPRARASGLGTALLHGALFSLRERGYTHALIADVENDRSVLYFQYHANARVLEGTPRLAERRYRTVVMASGNGTNFQTVIDAVQEGRVPLDVVSLVVNRANAYVIERAEKASIPVAKLVWNRETTTRDAFDAAVQDAVIAAKPDLLLLLGWMHVLPASFIERFPHILNVHPAFLPLDASLDSVTMPDGKVIPAFRGARAVDDALAWGSKWFGASVHRVNREVDRGEILVRAPLLREPAEEREKLLERIHKLEHQCLIQGIARWSERSALAPFGAFIL